MKQVRVTGCCLAAVIVGLLTAIPGQSQNVPSGEALAQALRADRPPSAAMWVENLDLTKMSSGWQTPQAGKSVAKNPITLKGVVYPHGIGAHAISQLAIDLYGGASRFVSMVGIDDEKKGLGSVKFQVWVDGKKQADSGEMHGGDTPKLLSVDLTGARRLVLFVGDAEDGIDSDHADWAGAMLFIHLAANRAPMAVNAPLVEAPIADEPPPPIFSYETTPPEPLIHGPRVTGATPGRPFLFLVPATGEGPLNYDAENLPTGLTLDHKTGVITGSIQAAGTTVSSLVVTGPGGVARRKLTIIGGDHKLALTPPMGWNSWNIYHCGVDEAKVRTAADWMVKSGLASHGFQYINIDDCWEGMRDANGEIQVNEKFGNMKALADYIHSQGLKFGIYSSPGPTTCAGHEASYQHEQQDADSYAKWGVDYLKYDWCSYGKVAAGEGVEKFKKPYQVMRQALDKADRDIVYSLCQYGMGNVWEWGADPDVAANLWRTTGDIGPSYRSMAGIGFRQNGHEPFAAPGHWNDPDMLWLHALKPNEQLTHMTLWSMLAAPLLIGSDLSKLTPFTRDVLSNDEVLEVDQDPLGKAASRRSKEGDTEVWARPLWDGTTAVALFNRGVQKADVTARWADLGLTGQQPIRDLWLHKDLDMAADSFTASVPAHGAILVKIGKPQASDYEPPK